MGRHRKKILFSGQTGTGKSTLIERMLNARVEKFKEPLIIYDRNRQSRWLKYSQISLQQFKAMKKGTYRIDPDVDWREFLEYTFKYFKGEDGVGRQALWEDATWLPEKKDEDINKMLVGLRHNDIDITATTHNIAETPLYYLRACHQVILLKTNDNWKTIRDRIPDHAAADFEKAFFEVNADPDPYAWRPITLLKTGTPQLHG